MDEYFQSIATSEVRINHIAELQIIIHPFSIDLNSTQSFHRVYFESSEIQSQLNVRPINIEISDLSPSEILTNINIHIKYVFPSRGKPLILQYEFGFVHINDILTQVYSEKRPDNISLFDKFEQTDLSFSRIVKRLNKTIYPSIVSSSKGRKISFR